MSLADTAKMAVELNLSGDFNRNLTTAGRNLDTFNSNVSKTARKVGQDLGHGIRTAGQNIERMAFAAGALAVGGGAAAVKWAGDFQAGMQTINSVAFATPEVLSKAGEGLRSLFRETGQSLEDLQSAEYDLVSAGIKLKDAQEGVNIAVHLGVGALGSTSEAVDVLTTAINSYNLKAADGTVKTGAFARVSDELAQAVADGKVKLSEIAASYAQVAPVAAQAGVKTGEIAAALGFLTAKGVPAAEVMTQMNRALVELQKPGPALTKVFKSLNTDGLALIKKEGLGGALEIIRERADKLKIPFIELFGRQEAYKFALQTTGPNAAGFAAELDRIAHSAGMTNKQFDERAQGFNYQMGVLKANVQDAGITIGTALLPKLTEMATKVADFLRGHQDDIKHFGEDLAKGFEKAANWAESIDWQAIGGAIKGLVGFGKGLAEAFMTLPADAKQLLLGLYALNKLGGGAVVNIGVDLAKGGLGAIFNQFLGRGSPANPMFVVPVGGGLGLPGAAVGAGEALAGAGVLTGAAAVAALALAAAPLLAAAYIINPTDPYKKRTPEMDAAHARGEDFHIDKIMGAPLPHGAGPVQVSEIHAHHLAAMADQHERILLRAQAGRDKSEREQAVAAAAAQKRLDTLRDKIEANKIATVTKTDQVTAKVAATRDAIESAKIAGVSATHSGSSNIVTAIRQSRPIVSIRVSVTGNTASVYQSSGTVSGGSSTRDSSHHTGLGGT